MAAKLHKQCLTGAFHEEPFIMDGDLRALTKLNLQVLRAPVEPVDSVEDGGGAMKPRII